MVSSSFFVPESFRFCPFYPVTFNHVDDGWAGSRRRFPSGGDPWVDGMPPMENRVLTVGSECVVYVEYRYLNNWEVCLTVLTRGIEHVYPVADPGFPRGEGANLEYGTSTYFLVNILQNCIEI